MNRVAAGLLSLASLFMFGCTVPMKSAMLIRDEGLHSDEVIHDESEANFALKSLSDSSKFQNMGGLESVEIEKHGFVLKFSTVDYYTTYQNSVSRFGDFKGRSIYTDSTTETPVVQKMNRQYFLEDIKEIRFFGLSEFYDGPDGFGKIFDGFVCLVKLPGDQFVAKGLNRKNVERVANAISKLSGVNVETVSEGRLRGISIDEDLQVVSVTTPSPLKDVPLLSKLVAMGEQESEFKDADDVIRRFDSIRNPTTLFVRTKEGDMLKFQIH